MIALAALGVLLASPLAVSAAPGSGPRASQNPQYEVPTLDYLNPFPVVRLAGRTTRTGVRITLLRVKAPRGSSVTVRCGGGRRRGCPFKGKTKTVLNSGVVRFRELERRLKAGVRLSIFVRRGETIGKHTVITVRRRKAPSRRDACILPGDPFEPAGCP